MLSLKSILIGIAVILFSVDFLFAVIPGSSVPPGVVQAIIYLGLAFFAGGHLPE